MQRDKRREECLKAQQAGGMLGQREGHKSEEGPLMIGGHVTFPEGHSGGHVSVCVRMCVRQCLFFLC